jgi:hypothetical protein
VGARDCDVGQDRVRERLRYLDRSDKFAKSTLFTIKIEPDCKIFSDLEKSKVKTENPKLLQTKTKIIAISCEIVATGCDSVQEFPRE